MAKMVAVTDKIHGRVASETSNLNLKSSEGFVHAALLLVLTDPALIARAGAMSDFFGDHGSTTLEKLGQ